MDPERFVKIPVRGRTWKSKVCEHPVVETEVSALETEYWDVLLRSVTKAPGTGTVRANSGTWIPAKLGSGRRTSSSKVCEPAPEYCDREGSTRAGLEGSIGAGNGVLATTVGNLVPTGTKTSGEGPRSQTSASMPWLRGSAGNGVLECVIGVRHQAPGSGTFIRTRGLGSRVVVTGDETSRLQTRPVSVSEHQGRERSIGTGNGVPKTCCQGPYRSSRNWNSP